MFQVSTDVFLEHHGVKGMHWGSRKSETISSAKTQKQRVRGPLTPKKILTSNRDYSTSEKVGAAFMAAGMAYYGVLTLSAIKMGR